MANPSYVQADTVAEFRRNLALVDARIEAAARSVDRDPAEIRLLPVSKTVPEERLRNAIAAGMDRLGENKVQEARRKAEALADTGVSWAVVGHLQTNKAKDVAAIAAEFHALDSLRVAEALDRRLQALGRGLDVLVQVNTSAEETKFGLAPQEVAGFLAGLGVFASLRVRGLMTLAEFTSDAGRVRACFARLRTLRDRLRQDAPAGMALDELSMGMSGDYELAVTEGATIVRVGQAIFGPRPTPGSDYWPGLA
jgi:pyridoxal phosphate enzyme (YggS family)